MNTKKRSKVQIFFDILIVLRDESKNEKLSPTRVARLANLPFDRFQKCLDKLVLLGFVSYSEGGKISITEKGLRFINEYITFSNSLKEMGLSL